jgi:hypothetical protein
MFVRDGNKNTRGVGAIASMDAVSPNRRLAEARAARVLARRDAVMALRTLGATRTVARNVVAPPTLKTTSTSTSTIETGQEAAFSRPPPPPGPVKIKLAQRPKGLLVPGIRLDVKQPVIKLPGSVIEPPKTPTDQTKQGTTSTAAPAKAAVTIVAGGPGAAWVSGAPKPTAPQSPDNLPPAWAPEPDAAPTSPAKPKASGNMLLYAAIGVGLGILWLESRKK